MKRKMYLLLAVCTLMMGCKKAETAAAESAAPVVESESAAMDLDELVRSLLTDMYNYELYEKTEWLEAHCTCSCLRSLAEAYEYECASGDCYAVWLFRTAYQDGDTDEHRMISVENKEDGYYDYTFVDMGHKGVNRVKIVLSDGVPYIDEIAQIWQQPWE